MNRVVDVCLKLKCIRAPSRYLAKKHFVVRNALAKQTSKNVREKILRKTVVVVKIISYSLNMLPERRQIRMVHGDERHDGVGRPNDEER